MPITALPAAPAPTDDRAAFSTKAFAHVAALDTFVTEANALEANVTALEAAAGVSADDAAAAQVAAEAAAAQSAFSASVVKWVSGTTYAQGAQTYSPLNFVTYRRKVAGGGTTDPSLDPTNWEPIWASQALARDLVRTQIMNAVSGVTLLAGGVYEVDTTGAAMSLPLPTIANTVRGDRIELINTDMKWAAPYVATITRPNSTIRINGKTQDLNLDLPMTGLALVCRYRDDTQAWWSIA